VPADFTMKFNISYNYFLPKFTDNEGNAVTVLVDSIPSGQLYFATIINNDYILLTPDDWSYFKDY